MSYTFDDLEKELLDLAQDVEGGKYAKRFLNGQGKKLNSENKRQAKASGIGKKTGNFMKGFKKGKAYKYKGDAWSIRAYNKSPHAHLINNGHRQIAKDGTEQGFVPGKHFMERAIQSIEDQHYKDVQDFIDDLIDKNNL